MSNIGSVDNGRQKGKTRKRSADHIRKQYVSIVDWPIHVVEINIEHNNNQDCASNSKKIALINAWKSIELEACKAQALSGSGGALDGDIGMRKSIRHEPMSNARYIAVVLNWSNEAFSWLHNLRDVYSKYPYVRRTLADKLAMCRIPHSALRKVIQMNARCKPPVHRDTVLLFWLDISEADGRIKYPRRRYAFLGACWLDMARNAFSRQLRVRDLGYSHGSDMHSIPRKMTVEWMPPARLSSFASVAANKSGRDIDEAMCGVVFSKDCLREFSSSYLNE